MNNTVKYQELSGYYNSTSLYRVKLLVTNETTKYVHQLDAYNIHEHNVKKVFFRHILVLMCLFVMVLNQTITTVFFCLLAFVCLSVSLPFSLGNITFAINFWHTAFILIEIYVSLGRHVPLIRLWPWPSDLEWLWLGNMVFHKLVLQFMLLL